MYTGLEALCRNSRQSPSHPQNQCFNQPFRCSDLKAKRYYNPWKSLLTWFEFEVDIVRQSNMSGTRARAYCILHPPALAPAPISGRMQTAPEFSVKLSFQLKNLGKVAKFTIIAEANKEFGVE